MQGSEGAATLGDVSAMLIFVLIHIACYLILIEMLLKMYDLRNTKVHTVKGFPE